MVLQYLLISILPNLYIYVKQCKMSYTPKHMCHTSIRNIFYITRPHSEHYHFQLFLTQNCSIMLNFLEWNWILPSQHTNEEKMLMMSSYIGNIDFSRHIMLNLWTQNISLNNNRTSILLSFQSFVDLQPNRNNVYKQSRKLCEIICILIILTPQHP